MSSVADLFDLRGRVALITGGAGHLGAAMSRILARAGASVVLASRNLQKNRRAAAELRLEGASADAVRMDITDTRSVEKAFRNLERLDILVNNAYCPPKLPRSVPPQRARFPEDADWIQGLDGAVGGVFRLLRSGLPLLRRSGHASVINISTMYALVSPDHGIYGNSGEDNPAYYGAAKAGVLQLTRYYARLLGEEGIRVNAISPGPFPSKVTQKAQPAFVGRLKKKVALGRMGTPEDLMGAVLFLASDASSYVTGHNLVVDGGWTA